MSPDALHIHIMRLNLLSHSMTCMNRLLMICLMLSYMPVVEFYHPADCDIAQTHVGYSETWLIL